MILTEKGKLHIQKFISELKAKRKEVLDAGMDTADATDLPTEEDIVCDIKEFIDEEGDYYNGWGCTDNTDLTIGLTVGEDFLIEEKDTNWVPDGLLEAFEERKSRCQDCAALITGEDREWVCDETNRQCKYIEDCGEWE